MAIPTLFHLENQSSLPFKRGCVMNVTIRDGIAAPGIHVRTPRCEPGEMSKCPKRDRDQRYSQNRDRTALPTFFTFAGNKREKQQPNDHQYRADQECWRFERGRKQREQSI